MARNTRSLSGRARFVYGVFCILLGCYPIALALGIIPINQAGLTSPRSVIGGAGLAFVVAGFMILLAQHSRANNFLAGLLLLLFSAMGTWVALFSSDAGFSGGLPFLSAELNILIGRWVFGIGALICFALCVYAFRLAASRPGFDAGSSRT
jgi:hypothetical protein